jgi:GT2 family glycosyltransferase
MPGLSYEIVIPSYKRWPTLLCTVANIRKLYPEVDVCIGLQGDAPESSLPISIANDTHLRIQRMPFPSSTVTMTTCIQSSSADVILILDDDACPCPGWLENHVDAFEQDADLVYTGGREVRLSKGITAFSTVVRIIVESFFGLFLSVDKKINGRIVGWFNGLGLFFGNFDQPGSARVNNTRGCNMAVRREAFLAAGGFSPNIIGNGYLFEVEFGLRLAKQGKLGKYLGNAVVIHQETANGGSRAAPRMKWFRAYVHNHAQVMKILGPQGWIGSVPRLVKRLFF